MLVCACDGGGRRGGQQARDAHAGSQVGGQVVSTVDGTPITLGDVRALVGGGELAPAEALRRLQDEKLLAEEAARRGLAQQWAVSEVGRKAAVQALLTQTANQVAITDADLEAAYAQQRERFEKPELRAAVHLLAKVSPKADARTDAAARAAVERLAPLLASATDVDGFVHAYRKVAVDGVSIICERLPLLPREGRLVQSFADAMFSRPDPGMVPGAVKTPYGWHVIRLVEIAPPQQTPKQTAFAELRGELVLERRKQRVNELLAQLARAYPVQLSDNATQSLASLSF